MKKILAIHDGHNASAAVFNGDEVLAAVSEERLNREKFYWGFPHRSIAEVLKLSGMKLADVEVIAVSHLSTYEYLRRKLAFKTTYTWNLKHLLGHLFNLYEVYRREKAIEKLAKKIGKPEVFFCDHHQAHAASAYFYAGHADALVITIDGLGDSLSHTTHAVRGGKWEKLTEGDANASLGAFYAAITEGLGFTPNRHEGKVVGLAALASGAPARPYIEQAILLSSDGLHFSRQPYAVMVANVKKALAAGVSRESIAACAQEMLEEIVLGHVRVLAQRTGLRHIACAGGVFSNVKLNQRILETGLFDDMFVQPAMGDEGLVLGAPFEYLSQEQQPVSRVLSHVYLGTEETEERVRAVAERGGYTIEALTDPASEVAALVARGELVGWFDGKMEFGPRALGARTIMADPRNRDVNKLLNERLRRSEFMPFAPSALAEEVEQVFDLSDGAKYAAEFMTITCQVKDVWHKKVPAIVHADGTARPQLVRKDRNPAYHAVLEAFFKQTGVPLIVNTSFNIHEEPIVASAEDALRSLDSGAVDCVVFNNALLVRRA